MEAVTLIETVEDFAIPVCQTHTHTPSKFMATHAHMYTLTQKVHIHKTKGVRIPTNDMYGRSGTV